MDDAHKELIEARRLINVLSRSCRQAIVFLDGKSALDTTRLKRLLQKAVNDCEKFSNTA